MDDTIDDDTGLTLINLVKNKIEAIRQWIFLQTEDTSITFSSSDTYKTTKTLPSDFVLDLKVYLGIEANDDYSEYSPCSLSDRRKFKNSQRYCIDWKNFKMYICGSVNETKTVFLEYIYQTSDITLLTSPVWPTRFHKILSFLAAEIYKAGIDPDEINLNQALKLSFEGRELYKALISWDDQIRLRAINGQAGFRSARVGAVTDRIVDTTLGNA